MGLGLNCIVDNVILCVGSQKNSSILEIIKSNRVKETWLYIYIYARACNAIGNWILIGYNFSILKPLIVCFISFIMKRVNK